MRFLDDYGNDIIKQAWKDDRSEGLTWIMQDIPKGKEIIGVYGNKSRDRCYLKSLSFILWTPNPHVREDPEGESFFFDKQETLSLFWLKQVDIASYNHTNKTKKINY